MSADCVDRWLVTQVQSGNRRAFDELVQKYRRRLLKLALRYTRNPADAEDVVQDTFLKAYRAVGHFRGDAAFYSWLHRIAVNSAKTASLQHARQRNLFTSCDESTEMQDGSLTASRTDTPQDLALTEELGRALEVAIEKLPEDQRTALSLRELQGLSYSEVAHTMSCPIGTVRSRIFRARDAIDEGLHRVFDGSVDALRRHRTLVPARAGRAVAPRRTGSAAQAG